MGGAELDINQLINKFYRHRTVSVCPWEAAQPLEAVGAVE